MSVPQVLGTAHTDIQILEQIKLHITKFYEIFEAENLEWELTGKKGNKRLLSKEGYAQLMYEIQNAKLKKTTKTSRKYNLLDTYEIFALSARQLKGGKNNLSYLLTNIKQNI